MGAPFVWFDLTAAGGEKVREFYADLFGWTIGPGAGDYQGWITDGEQPWAGITPAGAAPAGRAVHGPTLLAFRGAGPEGGFSASLDRRSGALLVKLPQPRVGQLITAGHGEPFAPAGRVFREWVAIPTPDRRRWQRLLAEA